MTHVHFFSIERFTQDVPSVLNLIFIEDFARSHTYDKIRDFPKQKSKIRLYFVYCTSVISEASSTQFIRAWTKNHLVFFSHIFSVFLLTPQLFMRLCGTARKILVIIIIQVVGDNGIIENFQFVVFTQLWMDNSPPLVVLQHFSKLGKWKWY